MLINKKHNSVQTNRLAQFVLSPLFISTVIIIITFITFARVLSNDFVNWDDDWLIYNNRTLGGLSLENLRLIFANVTVSSLWYTPLTGLRWCITYDFCRLNPSAYHIGNLLFHAADAVLIFSLVRKLLILTLSKQSKAGVDLPWITVSAAFGALVWSLHPLRVEPVAWAASGSYGQALFFLLISLLCYLRASDAHISVAQRHLAMATSVISYVFSLLSHAIGMTFFLVLIVLDVYPLGRLGGKNGLWRSATVRHSTLLEKLPFAAAALAIGVVTVTIRMTSAGVWEEPVPLPVFGLIDRIMQAMYIWAYYIWRPWYPVNLSPVYTTLVDFNPFSLPFVASGLSVIGAVTVLVLLRRRWPLGLTLGICHLVLLLPVLGVQEHLHFPSDRYSLVVSISWSILLATWLANLKSRRFLRSFVFAVSISVIIALGLLSFRQAGVWNNSVTLFEHMIRTLGDDPYLHNIHWRLGTALANQGRTEEAISHYYETLRINPNHAKTHNNLGNALDEQGRTNEAIDHYFEALRINPRYAEPHYNLGFVFANQGRTDEAITHYSEALRIIPSYTEAHNNLGFVLVNEGRITEAISHFSEALRIKPSFAEAHNNLGFIMANEGRITEAVKHFSEALRIQPEYAEAHNNLGIALANQGRITEAISHFSEALRIDPSFANAQINLENALSLQEK